MYIDRNWDEIFRQQYDFANQGIRNYYEEFHSPEAQRLHDATEREKSVNVVVYGNSQVGKTTLIFRLLGIDDESAGQVRKCLRSRPHGVKGSDTMTALLYDISEEESLFGFRIGSDEWEYLDDEGIKSKLIEMREKVENNRDLPTDLVFVSIPRKFFTSGVRLRTKVIDLPGVNSKTDSHFEHVQEVIKKYFPISNLIILVADHAPSIHDLKLPTLRNWRYYRGKYRVVLTFSASQESVRLLMSKQSEDDLYERYTDHYSEQFKIGLPDELHARIPKIYPVEYAESWEKLKREYPEYFEQMSPVVDRIFEDIRTDLEESSTDFNRIMSHVHTPKTIEGILHDGKTGFQSKLDEIVYELRNKEKNLGQFSVQIDDLVSHKLVLEQVNLQLSEFNPDAQGKYDGEWKLSAMKWWVRNYLGYLRREIGLYCASNEDELNKFRSVLRDYSQREILPQMMISSSIDDPAYDFLQYEFPFIIGLLTGSDKIMKSATYDWLRGWAKDSCEVSRNQLTTAVSNETSRLAREFNENKSIQIKDCSDEIERKSYLKSELDAKIAFVTSKQESLENERDNFEQELSNDLEIARKFIRFPRETFQNKYTELINQMNAPERVGEDILLLWLDLYLGADLLFKMETDNGA